MPKQKSHSGAKKRFTVTGAGRIKRAKMNRRHILTFVSVTQEKTIRDMI